MARQHVDQRAVPEVVGHEVFRKSREPETRARCFVQQAEIVADQAGGNVDRRAPGESVPALPDGESRPRVAGWYLHRYTGSARPRGREVEKGGPPPRASSPAAGWSVMARLPPIC